MFGFVLLLDALLRFLSSFEIISKRERGLVTLLYLSFLCLVTVCVIWLFFTVLLVGLQCVIVVIFYHSHLRFDPSKT